MVLVVFSKGLNGISLELFGNQWAPGYGSTLFPTDLAWNPIQKDQKKFVSQWLEHQLVTMASGQFNPRKQV